MVPGEGFHKVPEENGEPSDCTQAQPVPALTSSLEPSEGGVAIFSGPQDALPEPCPHCGRPPPLVVPGRSTAHRLSAYPANELQHSSLSAQRQDGSKRRRSSDGLSRSTAATQNASCLGLLLACLSCQCSVLLLGLLEACASCLHALCSSCCHGCARCCAALQEVPMEELNCQAHCHAVLFESCCESTECLEFCLECCQICHHT